MKFFIRLASSKRVSICLTASRVILGHEVALSCKSERAKLESAASHFQSSSICNQK